MSDTRPGRRYGWKDANPTCAHEYLWPVVRREVTDFAAGRELSIADIGCGNGYIAGLLAAAGHRVVGIDPSPDGIAIARASHPNATFEIGSVYDGNLGRTVGSPVDCVVALEVIEHLYSPHLLFERARELLRPGGRMIVSTPYHGYLKNLAISLAGAWDRHFGAEREGGHIKFFSRRTLSGLARAAGMRVTGAAGSGRVPGLWKSLVMVFER